VLIELLALFPFSLSMKKLLLGLAMLSLGSTNPIAGTPIKPQCLYLAQLKERLGLQAVKNIGY
jgi:hypothetical protein